MKETEVTLMVTNAQGQLARTLVVAEPTVVLDDVPVGGAITVVYPGYGIRDWGLLTVAEVQPPGELWFGESKRAVETGMFSLEVPKGPPMEFSLVQIAAPCLTYPAIPLDGPVDIDRAIYDVCHSGDSVEGVAMAADPVGMPLAVATEIDVPLTGPERIAHMVLDSWDTGFGRTEVSYTQGDPGAALQIELRPFRGGLAFPVHEPASPALSPGDSFTQLAFTEASIHDELQIWISASYEAGFSYLNLRQRNMPERGETERVELMSDDLVPVPEGWALVGDRAFELPVEGWDCDGRSADVVQLRGEWRSKSGRVSWDWIGPHSEVIRLPEVDERFAPPAEPGSWRIRASSLEGGFDAIREHPLLLHEGHWLSVTSSDRVCTVGVDLDPDDR